MITSKDVVTFNFTTEELEAHGVFLNSEKACIGGRSEVRAPEDRMGNLGEDQWVGQICNYAGCLYLTGDVESYHYIRDKANAAPTEGDGGIDIPGFNIDIKGSLMRSSPDPLSYRLPVRPREKYDDWMYILSLIRKYKDSCVVHLVGWAKTDMLPKEVDKFGVFKGAYTIPAHELRSVRGGRGLLSNWRERV